MSVRNKCLCLDEQIAIPKAIKDAVLEDIHSTQRQFCDAYAGAKNLLAVHSLRYFSENL